MEEGTVHVNWAALFLMDDAKGVAAGWRVVGSLPARRKMETVFVSAVKVVGSQVIWKEEPAMSV